MYSVWRNSPPEVLLIKRAPKNTTKSIGEHLRRSATPTKPPWSLNEVALQCGCSNINPQNHPPKEHPQMTAPAYIQKSKDLFNFILRLFFFCVCVCVRYLTVRYLNLWPVLIIDNCPVIIDNCPEGGGKLQFLQKILILR